MAETNATPTEAEVTARRGDINNYLVDDKIVADYTAVALAQFKRDLFNKRAIKWSWIFDTTNDLYYLNTAAETWNDDNCINMIALLTVAYVFADYAISNKESQWMELSTYYRAEYDDELKIAKLDVDTSGDGAITDNEEGRSGQAFFVK